LPLFIAKTPVRTTLLTQNIIINNERNLRLQETVTTVRLRSIRHQPGNCLNCCMSI